MSPFHVVHVEDIEEDSELIRRTLENEGLNCIFTRVETLEKLQDVLRKGPMDLVLSDNTLPKFSGLEALEMVHQKWPEVPFIFVSGTIREEVAVESLHHGAWNYLSKDRLWQLGPAVSLALRESQERHQIAKLSSELRETQKLASIATVSSGLVHDFRNLLHILKLNIGLLSAKAFQPEAVVRLANSLDKATDRGCNMAQEFMTYVSKTKSRLQPINIGQLIEETVVPFEATLAPGMKLSTRVKRKLPRVMGDSVQIDRVIVNLLRNAADAIQVEDGAISVKVDMVRLAPSPSGPRPATNIHYVRVAVTDNGHGMDEATRARIFEPFFTTKGTEKGTGLGLPIVLGLMEAHNGFVEVKSQVGKGTTFSLFFPGIEGEERMAA